MNVRKIYLIIKMIFCFYYIIRSWYIVFTSVLVAVLPYYIKQNVRFKNQFITAFMGDFFLFRNRKMIACIVQKENIY